MTTRSESRVSETYLRSDEVTSGAFLDVLNFFSCWAFLPWDVTSKKGVKIFGRSWASIARLVGTRTNEQVRAHAKLHLNKDLTEKRTWRSETPRRSKRKLTTSTAAKARTPCRKVAADANPVPGVGVASTPAALAPSSVPARPARREAAAAAAPRIDSTAAGGDADGGDDDEWCRDAADAGDESSSVVADGSENASESKAREETRPPCQGQNEEAKEGGRSSKRARLPGEVGGGGTRGRAYPGQECWKEQESGENEEEAEKTSGGS